MFRSKTITVAVGVLGALLARTQASAVVLIVDDDNVPCITGNAFHTINAALVVANTGDEIQICPGVYPEQVVLTKSITLRGMPMANKRVTIMPADLPVGRQSTQGASTIRAAILVDAPRVVLDGLDVDLTPANLMGCSPIVAGIYLRNASGAITHTSVRGAHSASTDCDTGVGLLIEGGKLGEDFGRPIFRKAVVSIRTMEFRNNQKGGIVATGDGTVLKLRDSGVFGLGPDSVGVPNGIEISAGARARLQDVAVRDLQSAVAGKTATGVLGFEARKLLVRRATMTDVQTGIFVVGRAARILDGQFGDLTSDGIVFLGDKNRAFSNDIDVSSVSGVFIDGDHNVVRGGTISRTPVGVWFFDGDRNIAKGVDYNLVQFPERVGDTRVPPLTDDSVVPLSLQCVSAAECDDGNPCTTDACTPTGACTATAVPNFTPCADGTVCNGNEVCLTGVCQPGTPLVCVDGLECTQDLVCDPTLGCQYPNVPDGTSCNGGAGTCTAGVCS
jgi:hypothetical protein